MRPSASSAMMAVAMASPVRSGPFEDAEREMRRQQDRRDEQRRQVAVVEPEPAHCAQLLDPVHAGRTCSGLTSVILLARRPGDHGAFDLRRRAEPEVQAPLVLRAEAAGRHQILPLHLPRPVQLDARADRAAVALACPPARSRSSAAPDRRCCGTRAAVPAGWPPRRRARRGCRSRPGPRRGRRRHRWRPTACATSVKVPRPSFSQTRLRW